MALHRRLTPLAALLLTGGPAIATDKPMWELGIGMSALSFPDYRGSDESGFYAVPFPYFV